MIPGIIASGVPYSSTSIFLGELSIALFGVSFILLGLAALKKAGYLSRGQSSSSSGEKLQ
jgi:hypothetical protein